MKTAEKASVALIFGGRGYEHDISVRGAEYVFPLIDGSKYRKIPIYIRKNGAWVTSLPRSHTVCPRALVDEAVPLEECFPSYRSSVSGIDTETAFIPLISAFPLLHGDYGEDGVVQGALENARIPYVGCKAVTSALARDKAFVKLIAERLGIPTAKWISVTSRLTDGDVERAELDFGYPMFVKPARLGSSIGTGIAKDRNELKRVTRDALAFGSGRVVVEEFVSIEKELECGYFSAKGKELFTEVGEISYSGGFYDYEAKYLSKEATTTVCASISSGETKIIQDYAAQLAKFLGLSGLSRIDFFRTKDGKILFNEINTMPGFTESSLYPRLVAECGISPRELVDLLIEDTLGD